MKYLVIDRFEGNYALCEDAEKKLFAIELGELPKGAGEGDVLCISDQGELSVDAEETARRRARIGKKQKALWE